ncbi:MAG TPA: serine/threonine-protein kinase [Polyangiaceae bacterium]|jgi:serine/threonine-protein kinase|nr:serine/threonine-protein kinase [Polyangiaceae bacterium]
MDLEAGQVLGSYVLERRIGTGGMGAVWAARDQQTSQVFALKILHAEQALADDARIRLRREAHATRSISHRAIVPVLEVIDCDGAPVLVMELLEGETLRAILQRTGRQPLSRMAELLLPVAEALELAHLVGIVHRDLKPENIFVQTLDGAEPPSSERVRLLDFGVARFHEPPEGYLTAANLTGIGTLIGTAAYMAPEQALRPSEVDQRVDIWALGVTLYEALSGCRPIEGASHAHTLRQLLVGSITPIEILVPELATTITRLIGRMLSRNPDRRPDGCREIAEILRSHCAPPATLPG